jgi:CMP-N,N'-diacetyllegionaminic acid synthase
MFEGKKILAIVPARGGSKGIPNKNIIDVMGKPLIQYTLEEAFKSKYIDKVHISTDSIKIANIVKKLGCEVERLRPEELAKDDTKTIDVLVDVLKYFEKLKEKYEIIILLQPTQPLRTVKHIDEAIECYMKNCEQGLVSVSLAKQHPILMRKIDNKGCLENLLGTNSTVRRQEFNDIYIVNGAIYINDSKSILENVSLNDNPIPYYMNDGYINLDIDEPIDLAIFKMILEDLNKST